MRPFFNFLGFALLTASYVLKHRRIDEDVVRLWVDDVLKRFNIEVICDGCLEGDRFVIMPNHSSYFDILALYRCSRVKLNWIAKKELFNIPFLGKAMRDIGVIGVDRQNEKKAAAALLRFVKGDFEGGIVIFPQGTRKNKQAFKRGGVLIAKKKNLPIYPVRIDNSGAIMPVGKLALNSGVVRVKVFERIIPSDHDEAETENIIRDLVYD
ncbi:lysophospholipid acyltransferase family protein [Hippea sp. KM1]|uniref:lysophospholipid acyltransferase family protein n=1 Tax=Hippea sp. KM1 TaxID=944481 RepID=UPI00046D71C8|nr:lysophospholipid acyltransferase family protein [Hippea sp. KM1]